MTERLTLESAAGVARLTLTRGERGNAIDMTFAEEFERAAESILGLARAGTVKVVVLSAEGRLFCVGGDLEDFPSAPDEVVAHLGRMAARMHRALDLLVQIPVPIVTSVQGVAAGAGLGLVACGDVVVASSSAKFRSAYTAVGLSPDLGVSWLLPRFVGPRRAADMVLTNRLVSADEAEAWGLVSRVVSPELLGETVAAVVHGLLTVPAAGLAESKRLLAEAPGRSLAAHLNDEAATIVRLSADDDARRAREKFLSRA